MSMKVTAAPSPNASLEAAPAPLAMLLEVPIYKIFRFENVDSGQLRSLEVFRGAFDMYCPSCGRHSVFNNNTPATFTKQEHYINHLFSTAFFCTRQSSHVIVFVFRVHYGTIQKIGQFPSLADITLPDFAKYRPILGEERLKELKRGVGLVSHGIGVGAFVYLRRVFEWLVESARVKACETPGWSEETFRSARMVDKVKLLEDYLPGFLVQNRAMYGSLSVGVHTLGEQECLAAFPVVLAAIELALDEMLEQHNKALKIENATKSLNSFRASLPEG